MEHTMQVIARIRSEFPTKFGIPRQSGLVPETRATIVFNPNTAIRTRCAGWRVFPTSG